MAWPSWLPRSPLTTPLILPTLPQDIQHATLPHNWEPIQQTLHENYYYCTCSYNKTTTLLLVADEAWPPNPMEALLPQLHYLALLTLD